MKMVKFFNEAILFAQNSVVDFDPFNFLNFFSFIEPQSNGKKKNR